MRSQDIEMTFEDWERMPWRFGWKHEYWDGHAHISPRHKAVIVRLTIEPRDFVAPQGLSVRRVSRRDSERLIDTFLDAFGDGVEYCDYKPEDRKSTRLNSSHEWSSYAVFCLKKKKTRPNSR